MEATQKPLQKHTASMCIGVKDQQQTHTQDRKYVTEVGRGRHLDVLQCVNEPTPLIQRSAQKLASYALT
jgi:hypothetical protein